MLEVLPAGKRSITADVNRADRLAQTKFGDGYILSCGSCFVTGMYTCFLAKRCPDSTRDGQRPGFVCNRHDDS